MDGDGRAATAPIASLLPSRARPFRALDAIEGWLLKLDVLERAYAAACADDPAKPFCDRALDALAIAVDPDAGDIARIPPTGALVIVANHPRGAADGLAVLSVLHRVRRDVKVLATALLGRLPDLHQTLLPVDVSGGARAVARNASTLRAALRWLQAGGCVLIFPAGEVAHGAVTGGTALDSRWHPAAAALAVRGSAAVLPVHITGANGRLFRLAGRLHPRLRTTLLARELARMRGDTVRLRVGTVVPWLLLRNLETGSRIESLRDQTLALGAPPEVPAAPKGVARRRTRTARREPVAAQGPKRAIVANVGALGPDERLIEHRAFQVFCARRDRLEAVLPEIGRLRELTFRAVGEGSGRSRDLDAFDDTYLHLFVWDRAHEEVVGAYRAGPTDALLTRGGARHLYTRTLFDYDERLLRQLGPALELGRSFVRPEYQRQFSPLLLLWRGICALVARAPKYRQLFGAVSISNRYSPLSQQLLIDFLRATRYDARLGALVRAQHPPRALRIGGATARSLDELSAMLRQIETDGKDVPVLLRQYLKLNARLLGVAVDPDFSDTLDALMMVDLLQVDHDLLARYMGRDESAAFLAHHDIAARWRVEDAPPAGARA